MRSLFATLRQLVLPAGAQPGTPRIVIGPNIPADLVAHYAPDTLVGVLIFQKDADHYAYIANVDSANDEPLLVAGAVGHDGVSRWVGEVFRLGIPAGLGLQTFFDLNAFGGVVGAVNAVIDGPSLLQLVGGARLNVATPGYIIYDNQQLGLPVAWTPTWTQSATNPSGTIDITGRYMRLGSLCWVWLRLTIAAGTTLGTGTFRYTLPFTPAEDFQSLSGYAYDNSAVAGRRPVEGVINTGSGNVSQVLIPAGGVVTETAPFSWAVNDRLVLMGWYICAP